MENPIQMIMQMVQKGNINQNNVMNMFGRNPLFQQAQKMLQGGGDPQEIVKNVAKQKGVEMKELQELAKQLGLKL